MKEEGHASGSQSNSDLPSHPEQTPSPRVHDPQPELNVASAATVQDEAADGSEKRPNLFCRINEYTAWTPRRCRYDPENPPKFGWGLNLIFALVCVNHQRVLGKGRTCHSNKLCSDLVQATTVTVANLYYVQPILFKIADTFDVSFEEASSVATLLQAGYAAGLLFLCPLGDIFRRRPFILLLVFFTATLVSWIVPS